MHLDPMMPTLVAAAFVVLFLGIVLRRFHQPHVIVYLVAGVLMGPHGFGLFADVEVAGRVGEVGVVLLLFFVGMEVSLPRLLENWRVAVVGTGLQILVTTGAVLALGWGLHWPLARSILVGFVISLSSTAVVISVLRARGELDTQTGHDAMGILLMQDMAIVPMLLVIGLLADHTASPVMVGRQVAGGVACVALLVFLARKKTISLPFASKLRDDHELQIFAAFILCFGLATLTALAELSTALGAFLAGLVVASARETEWVHESLNAMRVIFVALFFVSIGMLIDVAFVWGSWALLIGLLPAIFLLNTGLSTAILRVLGRSWRQALYVGAMLGQIGEFSFVLAAVGRENEIVSEYGYQLSVALIALTLLLSPGWIALVQRAARQGRDGSSGMTPGP